MPKEEGLYKNIPQGLEKGLKVKLEAFDQALIEAGLNKPTEKGFKPKLIKLFAFSDYASHISISNPDWLIKAWEMFAQIPNTKWYDRKLKAQLKHVETQEAFIEQIRIFRHTHTLNLLWQLITKKCDIFEQMTLLSNLADVILKQTYQFLYDELSQTFGVPTAYGHKQHLVITAMGKLGGEELNFSSDVDLIFCYEHQGQTEGGKKSIPSQEFFTKLAQTLTQVLSKITSTGFAYRVDLRLRPHGQSGPMVLSFDALEHYYQYHGRDWERYAWVKARPLTGEKRVKKALLNLLSPFVYRRYLDFTAFNSLREMKQKVQDEVKKRGLKRNLKLGPGGIRQIEFIVQMLQLIRAGKEPQFKTQKFHLALERLMDAKFIAKKDGKDLLRAYRFLRKSEHLIQMINEEQTHDLPKDKMSKLRLSWMMGYNSFIDYEEELKKHLNFVQTQFEKISAPSPEFEPQTKELSQWWRKLWANVDDDELHKKINKKYKIDQSFFVELSQFKHSKAVQGMQATARARLKKFMPNLLAHLSKYNQKEALLSALLKVVRKILRRSSYLLLLNENPKALHRFVLLCSKSPWIVNQMASFPLLIDELLSPLDETLIADKQTLRAQIDASMKWIEDSLDEQMEKLRQFKLAWTLKLAINELMEERPLDIGRHLSYLAEVILEKVYEISLNHVSKKLQHEFEPHFGIIAYGNFGGYDLHYQSDLDLVFIYDDTVEQQCSEVQEFYLRLAQHMIHVLSTQTLTGNLYDIDVRLRPGGSAGLLVTSLSSYSKYLQQDAWTWEHQALVRARLLLGSETLQHHFSQLRAQVLTTQKPQIVLTKEIKSMREKINTNKARTKGFHLKLSQGALTDIEFIVQYYVLWQAYHFPQLLEVTKTQQILEVLIELDLIDTKTYQDLISATLCYQRLNRINILRDKYRIEHDDVEPWPHRVTSIWQVLFETP